MKYSRPIVLKDIKNFYIYEKMFNNASIMLKIGEIHIKNDMLIPFNIFLM